MNSTLTPEEQALLLEGQNRELFTRIESGTKVLGDDQVYISAMAAKAAVCEYLVKNRQQINEKIREFLGPAAELLDDDKTVEITRNPDGRIWIKQLGGKERTSDTLVQSFRNASRLCQEVAASGGLTFTPDLPHLEYIIPFHGARFTATMMPILSGIMWRIRKRIAEVLYLEDYLKKDQISEPLYKRLILMIRQNKNILIVAPQGAGKALPLDTPILTPSGWTTMGQVKVGDFVIGRNGKPTRVVGVYPQGRKTAYRVTFNDGTSTVCCDEHLWSVRTHDDRIAGKGFERVLSLADMLRDGYHTGQGFSKYEIPMVEPVAFQKRDLPLDPYVLGVLIGDGALSSQNSPRFSTADDEIVQSMKALLPTGTDVTYVAGYDYRMTERAHITRYFPNTGRHGAGRNLRIRDRSTLTKHLQALGLFGKRSHETFIPDAYLYTSVEQRVALLQGLFDTDASVDRRGTSIEFVTTSQMLAQHVVFLVQSLGGIATVNTKIPTYIHNGEQCEGKPAYRILVRIPNGITPFRLRRKVQRLRPRTEYPPRRKIERIEPVEACEMQCIAVDAPDHLYVINDCLVTHNTTLANAILNTTYTIYPDTRFGILEDTPEIQCIAPNRYEMLTCDRLGFTFGRLIPMQMRYGAHSLTIGEIRAAALAYLEMAGTTGTQRTGVATTHGKDAQEGLARIEEILKKEGDTVDRRAIKRAIGGIVVIKPVENSLPRITTVTSITDLHGEEYVLDDPPRTTARQPRGTSHDQRAA
jgi:Flp pilus assembly CpaF family ATPase